MARAHVALGSNLGDRAAHLFAGIAGCTAHGLRVVGLSRLWETEPEGGPAGQGAYLNAVVVLETGLDPLVVLRILQSVEDGEGRVRSEPGAPRTLDLDLLLHGDAQRTSELLVLPHPRIAERLFVLAPLAEVAPDAIVPGLGRTVLDLLRDLEEREGDRAARVRPFEAGP